MREYRAKGPAARPPTHPGAILREDVLPALRLSVTGAAQKLGVSRQALHAILAETASVTPEMAARLGKLCGNGAGLWLRLQQARDLWRVEQEMAGELRKIPTLHA
ncbi:MAG: HigA family addiction module antidote protein [Alphaproteobacteria bacterium]|nr:HigA family addiction module antidote protein [Alphaproteobacteria bacterium]